MLWVGALGSDAVASVGSSSFFVGLGYAINSMVVIGTTIKLAQAIGRKETEKEKEYINAGLVINLIIAFQDFALFPGLCFLIASASPSSPALPI